MSATIFALFDDIAMLMDDVATYSKIAIRKSVGVTGDDFAVTANQVDGIAADRELPVIKQLIKGSLINKFYLSILLLVLSYFVPQLILGLLILGACYLSYEAGETILEKIGLYHEHEDNVVKLTEKEKVSAALKTDFVLSAEIMIIALSSFTTENIILQAVVLTVVGIAVTLAIYGFVALLIRLDDIGLHLIKSNYSDKVKSIGAVLVTAAPKIMKVLSFIGFYAVMMVAGGIFNHLEIMHPVVELLNTYIPMSIIDIGVGALFGVAIFSIAMFFKKGLLMG